MNAHKVFGTASTVLAGLLFIVLPALIAIFGWHSLIPVAVFAAAMFATIKYGDYYFRDASPEPTVYDWQNDDQYGPRDAA